MGRNVTQVALALLLVAIIDLSIKSQRNWLNSGSLVLLSMNFFRRWRRTRNMTLNDWARWVSSRKANPKWFGWLYWQQWGPMQSMVWLRFTLVLYKPGFSLSLWSSLPESFKTRLMVWRHDVGFCKLIQVWARFWSLSWSLFLLLHNKSVGQSRLLNMLDYVLKSGIHLGE